MLSIFVVVRLLVRLYLAGFRSFRRSPSLPDRVAYVINVDYVTTTTLSAPDEE